MVFTAFRMSAGIAITLLSIPHLVVGQHSQGGYHAKQRELERWIASTDAKLTFQGATRGSPVNPFELRVIWCSRRQGNVCGGDCTVYTGRGDQCLRTNQSTECFASTQELHFCATENCAEPCNRYSTCGVRMDSGFCVSPFTSSFQIGSANQDDNSPPPNFPNNVPSFSTSSPLAFPDTQTAPLPFPTSQPVETGATLPEATSANGQRQGLSAGAIAGIVLGVLFLLGGALCAVLWLRYKTRRLSTLQSTTSSPSSQRPMISPFMLPVPSSSSPYSRGGPPVHEYQRSPTTEHGDMDSMYTSNHGHHQPPRTMTMSSMSYASSPSVAQAPPRPGQQATLSPNAAKRNDRVLSPMNRTEDDDDDGRSFGHYFVQRDGGFASPPHRVDSAEIRPHYSQYR